MKKFEIRFLHDIERTRHECQFAAARCAENVKDARTFKGGLECGLNASGAIILL